MRVAVGRGKRTLNVYYCGIHSYWKDELMRPIYRVDNCEHDKMHPAKSSVAAWFHECVCDIQVLFTDTLLEINISLVFFFLFHIQIGVSAKMIHFVVGFLPFLCYISYLVWDKFPLGIFSNRILVMNDCGSTRIYVNRITLCSSHLETNSFSM